MALVFALGSNGSGQLGIGHREDVSVPKNVLWEESPPESVKAVASGGNHTLLLDQNGVLHWSGDPASGACGAVPADGGPSQPIFSQAVLGRDGELAGRRGRVQLVAATWEASVFAALDEQGRNTRVYTCGLGEKGELGQGPLVVRDPRATQLRDFPPPGTEVVDLAACMSHVVAVLDNGDAYAWGSGRKGQIGSPEAAAVFSPRRIEGVDFAVKRAVCGKDFTCLLGDTDEGRVRVLGQDKWEIKSKAPAAVPGWKDIGAGWGNILVLKADGSILAWGRNDYSQCVPPDTPHKALQIAVGSEHALALLANGDVVTWGWGEHGNCGPSTKNPDGGKGQRNVIASAKYLPAGMRIASIGAGCATSWVVVEADDQEAP